MLDSSKAEDRASVAFRPDRPQRHGTQHRRRIAHVLESFAIGGGERVALEVAAMQAEHADDVWAITLADGDAPLGSEFRERHVETVAIPKGEGIDYLLVPRLAHWLVRSKIEIVHAHHPLALIYAAPAARMTGARVVYTMHGAAPDVARRMFLRRIASRLVDAFVVVSPSLTETAVQAEGSPPDKVSVIPNGVDTLRFRADAIDRRRARADLGLKESDWVVGTAARLAPEKDQAMMISAIAPLIHQGAYLLIAGEGQERASLEALAAELKVENNVRFLGSVADVPHFLRALDVFALSSRLEGLPVSILEAMATGLPVASTAVGGIASVIMNEDTGVLVQPGDQEALRRAFELLRAEPGRGRGIGYRARQWVVQNYSARRMQKQYAELYQNLFSGPPS
jgi:glycosyltransferase involved in cell wall biosynthesis